MFGNKKELNVWLSFSDLVIGSLSVFLLITVILLKRSETVDVVRGKIADDFKSKYNNQKGVKVLKDGTIRFFAPIDSTKSRRNRILFRKDSSIPTLYFKKRILSNIVLFWNKIDSLYRSNNSVYEITEIRIEGHTDSSANDDYNLDLSQRRALSIWKFIRDNSLLNKESKWDSNFIEFIKSKVVTVGFGEKKLIDKDGEYISISKNKEYPQMSRRVEFRLILGKNKK